MNLPIDIQLWSATEIAEYLRREERTVAEKIVFLPDFPKPIRIPTPEGRKGHRLFKAIEVIRWAESHQEAA